jgi:hypothetical protein
MVMWLSDNGVGVVNYFIVGLPPEWGHVVVYFIVDKDAQAPWGVVERGSIFRELLS